MDCKTIIVNLFGGPGSGKSTTAAGLFHRLKISGVNCELVAEYAKHVTWRENYTTLRNQIYDFAKQHDRMFHLKDKVDVIITDSPIIMGLTYCDWSLMSRSFENLVVDEFNRSECVNINYFINRVKEYNPIGRNQTEEEAKGKDVDIFNLLNKYNIDFNSINGDENAVDNLFDIVIDKLEKK
jgi:adenylate kinase family enzyme